MAVRELKYSNTNTYLIGGGRKVLLFDTGWAGTFEAFCRAMGEINIPVQYIDYILISHFHPDHCGIAQDIAALGPKIVVFDVQKDYIHAADKILEEDKRLNFSPIDNSQVKIVHIKESREFLKECGIDGQVLHTPGHSDDSISLCLDEGSMLVGDLNPLYELELHKGTVIGDSWNRLLALGPHTVYYGHAKPAHPTPSQLENALKYVAGQSAILSDDEQEDTADNVAETEEMPVSENPVTEDVSLINVQPVTASAETSAMDKEPSELIRDTVMPVQEHPVEYAPAKAVPINSSGPQIIQLEAAYVRDALPKEEAEKTVPLRTPSRKASLSKASAPKAAPVKASVTEHAAAAPQPVPAPAYVSGPQPALPGLQPPVQKAVAKPAKEVRTVKAEPVVPPVESKPVMAEPAREFMPAQPEVKEALPVQEAPAKKAVSEPLSEKELHKLVERIMKNIDKGYTIEYIAQKFGVSEAFAENVARMYLTHPGVGVQGILDRIELIGINARK